MKRFVQNLQIVLLYKIMEFLNHTVVWFTESHAVNDRQHLTISQIGLVFLDDPAS
jgi:hypothetical protein